MSVPTTNTMINTVNKNTVIFAQLAFNEFHKSELALVYFPNLNTLNNLKSLSARSIIKLCPATMKLRKLGRIAKKSIIPKKLKIYFLGFLLTQIRRIYSPLNMSVIIHCAKMSSHVYACSIEATLLSITKMTLKKISKSSTSSKSIPALVSVLKIIR